MISDILIENLDKVNDTEQIIKKTRSLFEDDDDDCLELNEFDEYIKLKKPTYDGIN